MRGGFLPRSYRTASDTALVAYIKQVYSGEATEPVVDPDAVDASFQLELDIDTK